MLRTLRALPRSQQLLLAGLLVALLLYAAERNHVPNPFGRNVVIRQQLGAYRDWWNSPAAIDAYVAGPVAYTRAREEFLASRVELRDYLHWWQRTYNARHVYPLDAAYVQSAPPDSLAQELNEYP